MSRLASALKQPALIGYLVAGHPSRDAFLANASALIEGGCRVLEVGMPFSDPIADGPTIQKAVSRALAAGTTPRETLTMCAELRKRHPDTPLVVMTYTNLAFAMGFDTFAARLRNAGCDGAILADMPPEASGEVRAAFGADLALVFLASPATTDERLKLLVGTSRGYLYVVGLFGTTGARESVAQRTIQLVRRIAPIARKAGLPIAVGFGVSRPEHVAELVAAGADGVVVGSAFVQRILDGASPRELGAFAAELARGLKR